MRKTLKETARGKTKAHNAGGGSGPTCQDTCIRTTDMCRSQNDFQPGGALVGKIDMRQAEEVGKMGWSQLPGLTYKSDLTCDPQQLC